MFKFFAIIVGADPIDKYKFYVVSMGSPRNYVGAGAGGQNKSLHFLVWNM